MKNFDFLGFEASSELKEMARKQLGQLLRMAPGVVGQDAYLVKTRSGNFEGAVKIYTAWKTFSANEIGSIAEEIVLSLARKVRRQIVAWNRTQMPVLPSARRWLRGIEIDPSWQDLRRLTPLGGEKKSKENLSCL